jgi:tetratricopeptide (TPR) repeat protein
MRNFYLFILVLAALISMAASSQLSSSRAHATQTAPHPSAPGSTDYYFNRGVADSDKKDYDAAIADYTRAIELNPQYAKAYYGRGSARFRKQDFPNAIVDFTKAIKLDPHLVEAFYERGNAEFVTHKLDSALTDFNKVIELNPQHMGAYFFRGNVRYAKDDHDGAIADYTKAIELEPKYADAYKFRGLTELQEGKDEQAQADLKTAIKLNPELKTMIDKLSQKILSERESKAGAGSTNSPSASQSSPRAQMTLEYNVVYSCNGERMRISHCRKDSDRAGFPPTQPKDDFCQVYYPDRPKRGGFEAMAVELRKAWLTRSRRARASKEN